LDFTTCTQCQPRWKITCTQGKIKKEKYIEMKNVVFKVKNIPFFYFPYLRYPLNQDGRATGILFPRFGTSSVRGFFLLNSFFWAIKPNVDLTIGVDYYGKAGIGLSEEFRYLFNSLEGEAKFYFFKNKASVILPTGTEPTQGKFYSYSKSDYYIKMFHKQRINFLNTRITAVVDRQSDANFLRLFSNNFESIMNRISKTSLSINSSYRNIKFAASASQNDTYYTWQDESWSLRYLPTVSLNINQQKLWKIPGYFSLDTSYSSISRKGTSLEEDNGIFIDNIKSKRLSINPQYSLRLVNAPWMSSSIRLISKNSFYPTSLEPGTETIINKKLYLGYFSSYLDLKGPTFSKIYEFRNSKLKHLITPGITIRYVTKIKPETRSRLIPIDNFDFPDYSSVNFSLTTRLLSKPNQSKSPTEILSYTISQDYYFDPAEANRYRQVNGKYPEFSELTNTLRLRLIKYFTTDATLVLNHYAKTPKSIFQRFSRIYLGIGYSNKNSFVNGKFYFSKYTSLYDLSDSSLSYLNRQTIGGDLRLNIPNFPIKVNSIVDYDITDKIFRSATFKVSYDYQCINLNAELKLYKYGNRIEKQFDFGITFGNFGMVKDMLGID